jgi:hypothetical protein
MILFILYAMMMIIDMIEAVSYIVNVRTVQTRCGRADLARRLTALPRFVEHLKALVRAAARRRSRS